MREGCGQARRLPNFANDCIILFALETVKVLDTATARVLSAVINSGPGASCSSANAHSVFSSSLAEKSAFTSIKHFLIDSSNSCGGFRPFAASSQIMADTSCAVTKYRRFSSLFTVIPCLHPAMISLQADRRSKTF
jgi:hypothetical protein